MTIDTQEVSKKNQEQVNSIENPCNGSPSIRWVNMTFVPMCGLANSNDPNPMKLDVELTIDTQEVSKKNQEQVNSIETHATAHLIGIV